MYHNHTCHKILAAVVITIALLLAIFVSFLHQHGLAIAINISRFFEVMIPILAVGALLKYLLSCTYPCPTSHTKTTEATKKKK